MIKTTLTLLIFILVVGCNFTSSNEDPWKTEEIKQVSYPVDLTLIDSLSIPISETIDPLQSSVKIFESNNTNYLYFLNRKTWKIELINIEPEKSSISIEINKTGPNGVQNIKDIYINNLDSILVIGGAGNMKVLTMLNKEGEVLKKWDLNDILDDKFESYWLTDFEMYPFTYDKMRKSVYFYLYEGPIVEKETQSSIKQIAFNLENEEVTTFGHLPAEFNDKSFYPYFGIAAGFTYDKVLNYFPSLRYIVSYNKDSLKNPKILEFNSKHTQGLNIAEDIIGFDPDSKSERKFLIENDSYFKMVNDPNSDLIFRFLKMGQPFLTLDGKQRDFLDIDFSVQIFNSDLELLKEVEFKNENDLLFPFSFAIGKKLYISNNNPMTKKFNEDQFKFKIYEVSFSDSNTIN